jgi:hypothetical protein
MYTALPFDTLKYANKLKAVGFTEAQAEVQAEVMAELINDNLATKRDLKDLEYQLLLKLGAMFAASIGIITALVKLL